MVLANAVFVAQALVTTLAGMQRATRSHDSRDPQRYNPIGYQRFGGAVTVNRRLFSYGRRSGPPGGYKRRRTALPRRLRGYARIGGAYARGNFGGGKKELKNFDVLGTLSIAGASAWTVPTATSITTLQNTGMVLAGLPQGTTQNSRTGRHIGVKSIHIKGAVVLPAGAQSSDIFYWKLIEDRQANGAMPANTDVFQVDVAPGFEFHNLDNSNRFKTLASGKIELAAGAGVATAFSGLELPIEIFKEFKKLKCVEMSSTAGALTEFKERNFFLMTGSFAGTVTFSGSSRVRFYDGMC